MLKLSGTHVCFCCGRRIPWTSDVEVESLEAVVNGEEARASVIAIGSHTYDSHKTIEFDGVVVCPTCHVSNKFDFNYSK